MSFGALAARTERSPSRSASAALFSAATATQVSAPPTLTRCAPASNRSPTEANPRWPSALTGLSTASQIARTWSRCAARRVEDVGARRRVRVQAGDGVVEVLDAVEVVLRPAGEDEVRVGGARLGDPLRGLFDP